MTKKNLTIAIDENIYNEAIKIPELDNKIEEFLKHEILLTSEHELKIVNDINALKKESDKINNQITKLIDELYNIRFNKSDYVYDESIFIKSMETLSRIHEKIGHIGKDQIEKFAARDHVPYNALLNYITLNTDFIIQEYGVIPK